jgi:hypothetical protein
LRYFTQGLIAKCSPFSPPKQEHRRHYDCTIVAIRAQFDAVAFAAAWAAGRAMTIEEAIAEALGC